jgi:geranylgeranyl diphosphate synthase, type II
MSASSTIDGGPGSPLSSPFSREVRAIIDAELNRILPSETVTPTRIHEAIRWSVFAGGKRFRPILLLAAGQAFGATIDLLLPAACALELIHTYSLIHDDLPSMDNDDLRRGRPTCHIKFDEATAILAGDALQTLAFQVISADAKLTAPTKITLIQEVAIAAGTPAGMVAGQAYDLDAQSRKVSGQELDQIHRLKTGALIVAAARCGALIAGATRQELEEISEYAKHLGLLFQITDDLLDITATIETLGKTPGKDLRSQKATYPGMYGTEVSQTHARDAYDLACAALKQINRPTNVLQEIADYVFTRNA